MKENFVKTYNVMVAQGDVMFIKVATLPDSVSEQEGFVVAHSETGHHHEVEVLERTKKPKVYKKDNFVSYLEIFEEFADVVHKRSFDTHETLRLEKGVWQIRRQREYTPEGFKRVED